jgi:hypothetical protein
MGILPQNLVKMRLTRMKLIHILRLGVPGFWHVNVKRGHMAELLSTMQTGWLLGGVAIGVWHEWWRRRAEHRGESAWRSKIGEELVYIWFGGIVLFGIIQSFLGESPPPDPSDFYPG